MVTEDLSRSDVNVSYEALPSHKDEVQYVGTSGRNADFLVQEQVPSESEEVMGCPGLPAGPWVRSRASLVNSREIEVSQEDDIAKASISLGQGDRLLEEPQNILDIFQIFGIYLSDISWILVGNILDICWIFVGYL